MDFKYLSASSEGIGLSNYRAKLVMLNCLRDVLLEPSDNVCKAYGHDYNNPTFKYGLKRQREDLGNALDYQIRDYMYMKFYYNLGLIIRGCNINRKLPKVVVEQITKCVEDYNRNYSGKSVVTAKLRLSTILIMLRDLSDPNSSSEEELNGQGYTVPKDVAISFIQQLNETLMIANGYKGDRNNQDTIAYVLTAAEIAVRLSYKWETYRHYRYEGDRLRSEYEVLNGFVEELIEDNNTPVDLYSHLTMEEALCLDPAKDYPKLMNTEQANNQSVTMKFLLIREHVYGYLQDQHDCVAGSCTPV